MADFWRGVQSALFYYFACTPCLKYSTRKKRRKDNVRDRKERATHELDSPMLYRQPSPFATNQYWAEEIRSGPGPPPKRLTKKARVARQQYLKQETKSTLSTREEALAEKGHADGIRNALAQEASPKDSTPAGWNNKLYQREDEGLWGLDEEEEDAVEGMTNDTNSIGGSSSAARFPSRNAIPGNSVESFYVVTNPPVNDLHPPVVSNPSNTKAFNQWMLQPPPSAKVMNGHEQVNRSRSGSGTSSRKGGELALSRKISHRLVAEKIRKVEMRYINDISDSSGGTPEGRENENRYPRGFVTPTKTSVRSRSNTVLKGLPVGRSPTSPTKSHLGSDYTDSGVDVHDSLAHGERNDSIRDTFYDYTYSKNDPIMPPFARTRTIAATPTTFQSVKRISRTHALGDLEMDKTETRRKSVLVSNGFPFFDTLYPNAPNLGATADDFLSAETWAQHMSKLHDDETNVLSPGEDPILHLGTQLYQDQGTQIGLDWPTARSFRRWSVDF